MKYHIITYGCQMNKSDSERLATILENLGYESTSSEQLADLIAVVACSVRQSAVDRIYGRVKIWRPKKLKLPLDKLGVLNPVNKKSNFLNGIGKNKKIILTGCIMPKDRKALKDKVDLIIDLKDLNKLPALLGIKNQEPKISDYLNIVPKYQSKFQAYVPISTGCNNYCTYCVVPYARGPEKYRLAEEIIDDVKCLIKNGYKEITLLGQNVNSYGIKHENETNINTKSTKNINFPKLLQTINDLPGSFWLRFITSHPKDLSDELIEVIARGEKICEYLHLPVQSGDNHILKAMNRHYTVAHYKNLIRKIRDKISMISVSTDIIVGFPGETKEQFNNTAKLMKEINFDMAYLAEYSSRPGTVAGKLKDDVPLKEKRQRRNLLNEILKKSALKNNRKYLNKIVEVLIDGQDENYYYGKTRTFKTVKIKKSPEYQIGDIIKTKINKIKDFCLEGMVIE